MACGVRARARFLQLACAQFSESVFGGFLKLACLEFWLRSWGIRVSVSVQLLSTKYLSERF